MRPITCPYCFARVQRSEIAYRCIGRAGRGPGCEPVLDKQLAERPFIAGNDYTIADIAIWPWYGALTLGQIYDGATEFLQVRDYQNLCRWAEKIAARPAVQRGRMVNRTTGDPASQLHERHDANDFLTKTQDKLKG